jgi:hypothetical protein
MSFDRDTFQKYSIIGSFENKLKLCDAVEKNAQFDMQSFIIENKSKLLLFKCAFI